MTDTVDRSVVVVGGGVAGITTAETLRAKGFGGAITVVGDEPALPYRRTALSKDLCNADLSADRITLRKKTFWAERDIDIRIGTTAASIDTRERRVALDDGTELPYDALVLATGSAPRRFDWMSDDVAVLRDHAQAMSVKKQLGAGQPLVVIGAGLIGLELAASVAATGRPVTVLEAAERPMTRVLPAVVAERLLRLHRDNDVRVHTGVRITSATADHAVGDGFGPSATGFVVAAVGTRPRTELGCAAGIPVDDGILVDAAMRTAVPGVYAVGDVARYPHPLQAGGYRGEHWLTAGDHGKVAAAAILADFGDTGPETESLPATPIPLAWTVQYGVNIQFAGWPGSGDRVDVDGSIDDLDATVRVFDGDRLVGAVAVGRPAAGRAAREEIACTPQPPAAFAAPRPTPLG